MSSIHSLKKQTSDLGTLPTPERLSPSPSQRIGQSCPLDKVEGSLTMREPRPSEQSLLTPPITLETKPAFPPHPTVVLDSRWPGWARPEEHLPIATARELHERDAHLRETQSKADANINYAYQDRSWSKTLQLLPRASAVWLTLVRSRWLVVETTKGNLELWDIGGSCEERPIATFDALRGSVDGCFVSGEPNEVVELSISTTSLYVYIFELDLPHRCENRLGAPTMVLKDILPGWAALKDKTKGVWAFAKHRGTTNQGFLYRPGLPLPSVHLACASNFEENQNVLNMLLQPNVIAVARNRSIDLYNPSKLDTLFDTQSEESLPYLTFEHSFPPPKTPSIYQARLLRRNPAGLKIVDDGSIAYASFLDQGWLISEIRCDLDRDHSAPFPKYEMLQPMQVATVGGHNLTLSWGESGSRMVILDDWQLMMKFAARHCLPDDRPDRRGRRDVNDGRILAVWPMPLELGDIPRCVAFDEATGIAVAGMASGKLLVADAGEMVLPSPGPRPDPDEHTNDFCSPYMRLKMAESPHPSSTKWLGVALNPAMHKPRKIKSPRSASDFPPGWTREVESYYPFANHPGYYLSIPWLIHDVAGIPFDARCIMVSSKRINPTKGENAAIIEVEVEFGIGGRLLLLLWANEGIDWDFFKFRPQVTSDNIVDSLNKGVALGTLCDPDPLRLDPLILGQWQVGDIRLQTAEEMKKLFPSPCP